MIEGVELRVRHTADLEDARRRAVRALLDDVFGASDEGRPLYLQRGWRPRPGSLSTLSPTGPIRTVDFEGGILVLPVSAPAYWTGDLACDWRGGDVW